MAAVLDNLQSPGATAAPLNLNALNTASASAVSPAAAAQFLDAARDVARAAGLGYAGGLTPPQAWAVVQAGLATLVDVRSAEERHFVGQVHGSVHVPWASGTALTRNPRFVRELEAKVRDKNAPLLLLCRSGKRSVLAAEAATRAGFTQVFNVLQGFEGELDAQQQRGHQDGWRFHGLPWTQD